MTSPVSAIEAIEKALDEFDREVQEQLSAESERADLWEELDVNASDLREVLSLARKAEELTAKYDRMTDKYTAALKRAEDAESQAEALQREKAELRRMLERCAPAERSKSWLPVPLWNDARALLGGSENAE